jgi:uncharacterized membrane protein YkoI
VKAGHSYQIAFAGDERVDLSPRHNSVAIDYRKFPMSKTIALAAFAAALGMSLGAAAVAKSHAPKPKISKMRAEKIAMRAAPGKIKETDYELEGGGWRWSFDIQQKGHIEEVGVDAMTGKIVQNTNEGTKEND